MSGLLPTGGGPTLVSAMVAWPECRSGLALNGSRSRQQVSSAGRSGLCLAARPRMWYFALCRCRRCRPVAGFQLGSMRWRQHKRGHLTSMQRREPMPRALRRQAPLWQMPHSSVRRPPVRQLLQPERPEPPRAMKNSSVHGRGPRGRWLVPRQWRRPWSESTQPQRSLLAAHP